MQGGIETTSISISIDSFISPSPSPFCEAVPDWPSCTLLYITQYQIFGKEKWEQITGNGYRFSNTLFPFALIDFITDSPLQNLFTPS